MAKIGPPTQIEDVENQLRQLDADAKPRVQKEETPGRYDDIRARGGRVNGVTARGQQTIAKLRAKCGKDV